MHRSRGCRFRDFQVTHDDGIAFLAHEVKLTAPDLHAEGTVMANHEVLFPGTLRLAIAASRDFCDYDSPGAGQQCSLMLRMSGVPEAGPGRRSAVWRPSS